MNLNISSPSINTGDTEGRLLSLTTSLGFPDNDDRLATAFANTFVLYTNQTIELSQEDAGFRAVEVLWHFCLNTYSVSVFQGIPQTTLLSSSSDVADSDTETSIKLILRTPGDDRDYIIRKNDVAYLHRYMNSVLLGTYSHRTRRGVPGVTATSETLGLAMFRSRSESTTGSGGSDENIRAVIGNMTRNVATSLSNA